MRKILILVVIIAVSLSIIFPFSVEAKKKNRGDTQREESLFTEEQQKRLIKAVPPPPLQYSLERENLKKRLTRFNDKNKISYIYLVSHGQVMAFYVVKGKVSSVNSKLTTGEQLVRFYTGGDTHVVESPQLDGSYGTNGDAIFFFTDNDVYVEWSGQYMLADQPLKLSTTPILIREIK